MTIRRIACCTDFSENAHRAVAQAVNMAACFNAKLYLLHVLPPIINPVLLDSGWIPPEMPRDAIILKIEEQMQDRYGAQVPLEVDYDLVVRDGHVSTEIIEFVRNRSIDLVVTGAYGLSGMGLVLFGSVAKRVAQKAACSVLIVRDSGP